MSARLAAAVLFVAAAGLSRAAAEVPLAGCRWELMARRSPGSIVGTSRWDAGTLSIRDEKVLWVDSKDPGRNVIVPLALVSGHSLSCVGGAAAPVCTEWRLRTRRVEFRFKDLVPGPNGSPRLAEIDDTVRSVLADLPAASPTDRR